MHALPAYLVFVLKVQSKMNERKSNKQKFQNPAKSHISFSKQSAKSQVNIHESQLLLFTQKQIKSKAFCQSFATSTEMFSPFFFRLRHHKQKVNSTQHRESAH